MEKFTSTITDIKLSVMIIDDSVDTLVINRILLESEGYTVFSAESGEEALKMLLKIKPPEIILLDMQMGDMSGVEFLHRLEEDQPEILQKVPIVFLTGMDSVPATKAVGYIQKPIDMDNFINKIKYFIKLGI